VNLADIREPSGPYWAAYQDTRARDHILDNPASVPHWFLAKLARERVAAARVALEQAGRDGRTQAGRQLDGAFHRDGQWDGRAAAEAGRCVELHAALRTVEDYLRSTITLEPESEQIVAALLGAQEIETARERAEAARQ
jgi:hypothetical protein